MDDPAGDLNQFPPNRRHRMATPRWRTCKTPETQKQVVCYHSNAEIHGIGMTLAAGHLVLAEPDLELFVIVLCLAALIVPAKHVLSGLLLRQIRGNGIG